METMLGMTTVQIVVGTSSVAGTTISTILTETCERLSRRLVAARDTGSISVKEAAALGKLGQKHS
jgi:hypothetical protein